MRNDVKGYFLYHRIVRFKLFEAYSVQLYYESHPIINFILLSPKCIIQLMCLKEFCLDDSNKSPIFRKPFYPGTRLGLKVESHPGAGPGAGQRFQPPAGTRTQISVPRRPLMFI